ncbi:tripartite motif-containing protein 16-like [Engraulis encrasicolus]|uniref:tripartite motif-containing protein 16-like n=1 Tax=Engraulis encrasicolus TaxID=184585 RepID=UPI002FD78727
MTEDMLSSSTHDIFTCSICLDPLKDPVSLHCGHNYCSGCINGCWDHEDQKGVYSCPQCRQTFTTRPVLNKNNVIAELVEEMRRTRPMTQCGDPANHGDVQCDICSERKFKAVKSCLDCVLSYCETHFNTHNELHPRRSHTVIDATGQLHELICPRHNRALEVFCCTDQSCICYLCTMDQHKGHDTISATAAWSDKKEGLGEIQSRCQQKIQKRKNEVQELRRAFDTLTTSAQSAVEHSDQMFDDIIRSVERRRSVVTELIRAQEKAELSRAERLLQRVERETTELKTRVAEMEQLSHTQDPIHFLKNVGSLSAIPGIRVPTLTANSNLSLEPVKTSVTALKRQLEEKLESIFRKEVVAVSAAVSALSIVSTQPVTREDFLLYHFNFTLDPNTANKYLHLSEDNRRVERRDKDPQAQTYPDHPERFEKEQILCGEAVSGRCYWEVEWSGGSRGNVAVAYKTIRRKGQLNDCWFGFNTQSWRLTVGPRETYFYHNEKCTDLPPAASSRVGVYVDHGAGTLAFYSISDTAMTLLHKVQTTFSKTLYPGFTLGDGSFVKLLDRQ